MQFSVPYKNLQVCCSSSDFLLFHCCIIYVCTIHNTVCISYCILWCFLVQQCQFMCIIWFT